MTSRSKYEELKSLCVAIDKQGMPIGLDEDADEAFQVDLISATVGYVWFWDRKMFVWQG